MPNPDPEDEIGDVPGPADRVIISPNADAGGDQIRQHGKAHQHEGDGYPHCDIPPDRGFFFDDGADVITDPAHRPLVQD